MTTEHNSNELKAAVNLERRLTTIEVQNNEIKKSLESLVIQVTSDHGRLADRIEAIDADVVVTRGDLAAHKKESEDRRLWLRLETLEIAELEAARVRRELAERDIYKRVDALEKDRYDRKVSKAFNDGRMWFALIVGGFLLTLASSNVDDLIRWYIRTQ